MVLKSVFFNWIIFVDRGVSRNAGPSSSERGELALLRPWWRTFQRFLENFQLLGNIYEEIWETWWEKDWHRAKPRKYLVAVELQASFFHVQHTCDTGSQSTD